MKKKIIKSFACFLLIIDLSHKSVFAFSSVNSNEKDICISTQTKDIDTIYSKQNSAIKPSAIRASAGEVKVPSIDSILQSISSTARMIDTTKVRISTFNITPTTIASEALLHTANTTFVAEFKLANPIIMRCDPDQITAADKESSVFFNWHNNVSQPGELYDYSYTTSRGKSGFGTIDLPYYQIFGMLPGESATLTVTYSTTVSPPPQSLTCELACGSFTETPSFAIVSTFCFNETPPALPTTSNNGIVGTWNPSVIDTSILGNTTYIFTPDPIVFPCAIPTDIEVSVGNIEPDFNNISICSGEIPPVLNTTSLNGIVGTWSPAIIDNLTSATYTFTPNATECAMRKTISVTVSPLDTILSINWTVAEAFNKNQIVTVTDPVGANYLYQMDSGPFQANPIFENIASGTTHAITVKEVDGCGLFTDNNVVVIGYPKYFTPNGDNYNDNWNISGLSNQLNCRIYIYDRYGKLIKDISPQELGWDGNYIGKPMPTDDYWFTVKYSEQNSIKKFKSHFSLKR